MPAWLSVWGDMQICICPSLCYCHSLSLAPVNPAWFYLSGITFLALADPGCPGQSPAAINGCSSNCVVGEDIVTSMCSDCAEGLCVCV